MPFLQFLRSLDDLLYELISWIVFYPITLWRALVHPLATMRYVERELGEDVERQYEEMLSPPQFLLITLLISHGLELAIIGQNPLIADHAGLARLLGDDTSLLLFRLILFSLFPTIMAAWMLRQGRHTIRRDSLRNPFYAQCVPIGPFALISGLAGLATAMHDPAWAAAGAIMFLAVTIWYAAIQVMWFRERLGVSWCRAAVTALAGLVVCFVAFALVAVIV